jgi:hypothetical protein
VRPAHTTGPYCLQIQNAENLTTCIDAQTRLYDLGYVLPFTARQQRTVPAPTNYGRYIKSLRPEQLLEHDFNALFIPDPTEGFSWIVSGDISIPKDSEILLDYGPSYWQPPHQPVIADQPPPPTTGKGFSSDPTGDGPGYCKSLRWTQFLQPNRYLVYSFNGTNIISNAHDDGLEISSQKMTMVSRGEMLPDAINPRPFAQLLAGAHAFWVNILHTMSSEEVEGVSLSAFVHRVLVPILETIQQQPGDLHILVKLKSTAVADLGHLRFNESTLPELLVGLRLSVAVWTPYARGWCATYSTLDPATKHLQLENERLTRIYPDIAQHQVLRSTVVMAMTQTLLPDDSSPM